LQGRVRDTAAQTPNIKPSTVRREEYIKAGQIKAAILEMQQFGKQLGALQQQKLEAVRRENFEVPHDCT
jgi:hypothetical protein